MARQFSDDQAALGPTEVRRDSPSDQRAQSGLAMGLVIAAVAFGAALGMLAVLATQAAQTASSSTGVLYAILGIKATVLAVALSLVLLRLRAAVRPTALVGYCAGLAASAAGLAWLWGLSGLLLGSGLFYGGLVLIYMVAARDPDLGRALDVLRTSR